MSPGTDGWREWGNHVRAELERHEERIGQLFDRNREVIVEIAQLKVKSGTWGAIGALIPIVVGLLIWLITR